jgi:predicted Zn-dependent protease
MDTYGWMLVNHGALEKGIDILERAASLAPDQQEIRYHYAAALIKSGKKDAAKRELETILAERFNCAKLAREPMKEIQN